MAMAAKPWWSPTFPPSYSPCSSGSQTGTLSMPRNKADLFDMENHGLLDMFSANGTCCSAIWAKGRASRTSRLRLARTAAIGSCFTWRVFAPISPGQIGPDNGSVVELVRKDGTSVKRWARSDGSGRHSGPLAGGACEAWLQTDVDRIVNLREGTGDPATKTRLGSRAALTRALLLHSRACPGPACAPALFRHRGRSLPVRGTSTCARERL
jgi:hypothetical protein